MRAPAKTFRELLVWQKAHQLVPAIYGFTKSFPRDEQYRLSMQLRRATISIPANIAEGFRKRGKADKARFMNMAEGSLEEVRYYIPGKRSSLWRNCRSDENTRGGQPFA